MQGFWDFVQSDGKWMFYVFIIVFSVLLINYALKITLNILAKKLEQTTNPWDDAFVESIRKPLRFLIWIIGISLAATVVEDIQFQIALKEAKEAGKVLTKESTRTLLSYIGSIRTTGIIVVISWFLLRLARNVEANIKLIKEKENNDFDHTTLEAISKLLRIAIVISSALIAMEHFNIPISGVVAFGGVGGIAVGFAARDLLANFFGAMMIYMDRPFTVGDWIRSPDRNIEGTVEAIGWRLTRIRTFNKRPLYVPNSVFTEIAVENPSRMLNRRIKETIGIRYDDANKMSIIVENVKAMLQEHDAIEQNQTLIVNFNKFAPSSLDFFIYTFTKTTNWVQFHEIKQDVMLKIINIIEEEGAECAFPTSTLHVPDSIAIEAFEVKKTTKKKTTAKKKTSKKKTAKKKSSDKKEDDSKSNAKDQDNIDNENETFKNEMSDDGGGE